MTLVLTTSSDSDNSTAAEGYSNPRKTRFAVWTEKKTFEIWVWGLRWMSSELGYALLFLVFIL